MGTVCPSFVRGRRLRVTRLDSGGRPVYGPCNMVTSSGFIQVEMSAETEDGEEINQLNAAGETCISEAPCPQLKWRNVTIDFCQVDPDLVTILNPTWRKELDDVGNVVGWRGTNKLTCDTGYALEVWTDIGKSSGNLDLLRGGQGRWGYLLLPFVVGGVPGDFTVQNGALTMQFAGKAQAGSSWGKGPYQVIMSNGLPSRLTTPIASDEDHLMRVVTLAPPAAQCGCQEVIRPIPDPPTLFIEGVAAESPRRTVRLRVDNHGFGPVLVTWGDGTPVQTVQDGALVEHQYPEPPEGGQDTYTLTVRDKQTPTVMVQREITIPLPPDNPTVSVTVDESDTARRTVLVDWDNHGHGPVTIDWGDLTDPETLASSGTGRKHVYQQDGYYTITVTDVDQPSHVTRVQLSIPVPATPTVSDPTADPADPTGRTVVLNVDNGGRGPTMIEWGDGKSEIGPSDATDVKHQYPSGGKEYTIKVYPQGNPVASVTKTYTVPAAAPAAPTNAATVAAPTTAGVDVTYEHDGASVTGFRLERAEGATGSEFSEVASTTDPAVRHLTDPGPLTAGTTYRWRVVALNGTTASPPSNEVSGTVEGGTAPAAPTNASMAAEPTTAGVDVAYQHDGASVTGFRLERAEGATGGTFSEVASTTDPAVRHLTDPGPLTAGTTYRWRVVALNGTTASPPSNEVSGTAKTAPAAPTNAATVAAPTTAGVDVTYEHDGANVTEFQLFRGKSGPDGPFAKVASTTDPAARQLTDPGPLTAGTTYWWMVLALNGTAKSNPSNAVSGTVEGGTAPAAPTNASTVAAPTTAGVDVTYEHDGANVTGFRLERAEGATGSEFSEVASTTDPAVRQLTDPGPLITGTTYRWRVVALNGTTASPPSNEVSGTVEGTTPAAPTNAALVAAPTTAGVSVTYEHDGVNVTEFDLEIADASTGGKFAEVASTTTTTDRQLTDEGPLVEGTEYRWRVRASNGILQSSPSNEVSGRVPFGAPPAPTDAVESGTSTPTSVTIAYRYEPTHGVTGFRLERKPATSGTWAQADGSGATGDQSARELVDNGGTGLAAGDYLYRVIAINPDAESAPSNEVPVTITAALSSNSKTKRKK